VNRRSAGSLGRVLGSLHRLGNRRTQPRQRFFRLGAPLRPAKSLRRGGIPLYCLAGVAGLLVPLCQFKRNHRVARPLKKLRELRRRVAACLGLANPRLYLSPISHARAL
jgi:hypothetical protein